MATRQDVLNWVSRAWESVHEDNIEYSFKACGISVCLDGTEDGLIHDRLANAMGGIDAAEQRRRLQMLFDSDSDSDADFSGFSAPESDDE